MSTQAVTLTNANQWYTILPAIPIRGAIEIINTSANTLWLNIGEKPKGEKVESSVPIPTGAFYNTTGTASELISVMSAYADQSFVLVCTNAHLLTE